MPVIHKQYIEKFNVNDTEYKVIALYKQDGSSVAVGEIIAVLETSKTAVEIAAAHAGHVYFLPTVNQKISIGSLFAIFSDTLTDKNILVDEFKLGDDAVASQPDEVIISKPAQVMMQQYGLDASIFKHIKIIKKSDVLNYLKEKSVIIENDLS